MAHRIYLLALVFLLGASNVQAACCYFSAQNQDVDQPGQKAFITWDPDAKKESFTVQPAFEGDAREFGMVIPTPTQPKLDEMPRDFFKWLAVYTILLPFPQRIDPMLDLRLMRESAFAPASAMMDKSAGGPPPNRGVRILEAGVVGTLDYKIITAENSSGLYDWLAEHKYQYAGDKETLEHYVKKKWIFTVMKIDTKQMKKNSDGSFLGEVSPTRFAFQSDSLVYPLKITAISVKKNTEALFYVQAPEQMDLDGDWSWSWSYRVMFLNSGTVCISQKQMTDDDRRELEERSRRIEEMRNEVPGYDTTKLEWSHRIGRPDEKLMASPLEHYPQMGFPDVPSGARVITVEDLKRELWENYSRRSSEGDKTYAKGVLDNLGSQYPKEKGKIVRIPAPGERTLDAPFQPPPSDGKPKVGLFASPPPPAPATVAPEGAEATFYWFPNREAPDADVQALAKLKGHLQPGAFLCKFRKVFAKSEMKRDLDIVPAEQKFRTEYLRLLPQSPP